MPIRCRSAYFLGDPQILAGFNAVIADVQLGKVNSHNRTDAAVSPVEALYRFRLSAAIGIWLRDDDGGRKPPLAIFLMNGWSTLGTRRSAILWRKPSSAKGRRAPVAIGDGGEIGCEQPQLHVEK